MMLVPIKPMSGTAHVREHMWDARDGDQRHYVDAYALAQDENGTLWYVVNVADDGQCWPAYASWIETATPGCAS